MLNHFFIRYFKLLLYFVLLLITMMINTPAVFAQQLSFKKELVNDEYRFNYSWTDLKNKQQTISFSLPTETVNDKYRHFKALRPSLLKMYSLKKLKQAASQIDPRDGRVQIKPSVNGIEFEFKSYNKDWMQKKSREFSHLYDTSLSEYLRKEYYIEFNTFAHTGSTSTKVYKPDHKRFALENATLLKPIVDAIKEKMPRATARNTAKFILGWLQTIPYNTIESRAETNGAGFLPPARVLANNIGDCDSKVTLMAALMKALYPRLNIAIIYVPQHAFIAFNMSHLQSDYKIKIEGLSYTFAEPVGPALLDFAEISPSSKRFIESGYYTVEKL